MDYHLEQLGDERFQKLCQSILVLCYPEVICLPVGQPDGGRDALIKRRINDEQSDCIIFQVKFSKNPSTREERDFIEQLIETETEKVEKLKARGATKYILLTNVSGTSHLDYGSIDKVNKQLTNALNIESYCWWRDDIERRIDAHTRLKWSFPEILKGTDLLEHLLSPENKNEKNQKTDVIKAYMAHQARHDEHLKFKQIEFQKGIIEQFVDTPARFYSAVTEEQQNSQDHIIGSLSNSQSKDMFIDEDFIPDEDESEIFGALQLMISPDFSKGFMGAVLEGAPGQGKSTVTQYLCQVNRLSLLRRTSELKKINENHIPLEARIPFRVDLRDYANWLSGRDPFSEDNSSQHTSDRSPLLESFIAAQIKRYTGSEFNVEDLTAISKLSQILIILDGFDEVADIKTRNKIVSEVADAAIRINENALSSQIIVTSRPTAFANSPGFSRSEWQHISMLPLTRPVINLYAHKWLEGRSIEAREKQEILSVLDEKLEQLHVRDLARNPMQLAILLALISVQGASLPDKRTALYDNYITIFLNRESEKSKVVRDHRELLIQIHRYLAWVLQSEAEAEAEEEEKSQAGNIGEARLREILKSFLQNAGHDTKLVNELFSGMVERVVALVSRVQGTFEFEVQPLREYFTARYLYDTAPYSPTGSMQKGTLPERFISIARNFYWLNVTRFYAGCYSSGELSSLIDGLDELAEAENYKVISQPSRLGLLLIKDHVFNQHPRLASRVITNIIKSFGFRALLASVWAERFGAESLTLSSSAGKDILISKCMEILNKTPKPDELYIAAKTLAQNCSYDWLYDYWKELKKNSNCPHFVVQSGSALGIYEKISKEEVTELTNTYGINALRTSLRNNRLDLLEGDENILTGHFVNLAKDSLGHFPYFNRNKLHLTPKTIAAYSLLNFSSSYFLSNFNEPEEKNVYSFLLSSAFKGLPLAIEHYYETNPPLDNSKNQSFINILNIIKIIYDTKFSDIKKDVSVWSNLIEAYRIAWGNSSSSNSIAIQISDAYETQETTTISIYDLASPLISRAISAKCNIQNNSWLDNELSLTKHQDYNVDLLLRSIFKWGTLRTLSLFAEKISHQLDLLNMDEWNSFSSNFEFYSLTGQQVGMSVTKEALSSFPETVSPRFVAIWILLSNPDSKLLIRNRYLHNYFGSDHFILSTETYAVTETAWKDTTYWKEALESIKRCYNAGFIFSLEESRLYDDDFRLPINIARIICENPQEYPISILSEAEAILLAEIGASIVPVGKIASENAWFNDF
ncbi:hypothetical protein K5D65_21180 [Pseudomonas cichorii]|nr:hypothetical protein [Pseudomonas cichorii]